MGNLSMTVRLTVAFLVLLALSCSGIVWTLYRALETELTYRDDQTLINRASQMKQLLRDGAQPENLPMYFNRMVDTRQDILLITSPGKADISINNTGAGLGWIDGVPIEQDILPAAIYRSSHNGVEMTAIRASASSHGVPLVVTVARVAMERQSMLGSYRRDSLGVCLIALLACMLISPLLIKRGLRAIGSLSQVTADTDSGRLHQPLAVDTLPAELLPLGHALNIMRQRLGEDFKRLTQFADDLAHELRTPINILLGQNQVALSQQRSVGEYQQVLAGNIEELEALSRLTANILFLARAEYQNMGIARQRLSLPDEIDNIIDFLSPLAEEKNMRFETRYCPDIDADKVLLQRAITNLLTNAIRYTAEGHTIFIVCRQVSGKTVIQVGNPGEPIVEADKLFHRFWRGDNARHTPGTGLGLSLVKAIAQLHGGEASYCYADGHNVFSVTFPGDGCERGRVC